MLRNAHALLRSAQRLLRSKDWNGTGVLLDDDVYQGKGFGKFLTSGDNPQPLGEQKWEKRE
jgi:hypothetical protein